jgi:heme-degrading monooxygenase HmoA
MKMADKPYHEMTDAELVMAMAEWGDRVDTAAGFPSAHFAAKQCKQIENHCARRGIEIENKWPITVG